MLEVLGFRGLGLRGGKLRKPEVEYASSLVGSLAVGFLGVLVLVVVLVDAVVVVVLVLLVASGRGQRSSWSS